MARVLLDTHTLIWIATDSDRLSRTASMVMRQRSTVAYVSVVSLWEIATKLARGSARELEPLDAYFEVEPLIEQGLVLLEVTLPHLQEYRHLPTPQASHADPFDRMLAAQARAEGLELLSTDAMLDAYGARRVWSAPYEGNAKRVAAGDRTGAPAQCVNILRREREACSRR